MPATASTLATCATELEAALPKWTKITDDPKTRPDVNRVIMYMTEGHPHALCTTATGETKYMTHQRNRIMGDITIKMLETLKMIESDMKTDAENFDGKSFTGITVGTYLGNQSAAIAALSRILRVVLEQDND